MNEREVPKNYVIREEIEGNEFLLYDNINDPIKSLIIPKENYVCFSSDDDAKFYLEDLGFNSEMYLSLQDGVCLLIDRKILEEVIRDSSVEVLGDEKSGKIYPELISI